MTMPTGRLLDVDAVADRLKMSVRHIRWLIGTRAIGVCRFGRRVRIPESELDRFISSAFTPALDGPVARRFSGAGLDVIIDAAVQRHGKGSGSPNSGRRTAESDIR